MEVLHNIRREYHVDTMIWKGQFAAKVDGGIAQTLIAELGIGKSDCLLGSIASVYR